jgi:hypothetical protein
MTVPSSPGRVRIHPSAPCLRLPDTSLRSPDNQSCVTYDGLCPRRSYYRCFILSCSTRRAVIVETPAKADAASSDSGASAIVPTETSVFKSRWASATSLIPI